MSGLDRTKHVKGVSAALIINLLVMNSAQQYQVVIPIVYLDGLLPTWAAGGPRTDVAFVADD